MLLLPAVVLVATLPDVGRTEARRDRGGARGRTRSATAMAGRDVAEAELVAKYVAADHGIPPPTCRCGCWPAARTPAIRSEVEVRVRMPAIAVPGVTRVGAWTYSTVASLRVDDYRSR